MPFVSPSSLRLSHQIQKLLHLHCWHLLEQGEGDGMYNLLLFFCDGFLRHCLGCKRPKREGGALFSWASLDPIAGGNFPATVPRPNSTGGTGPEVVVELEMELEV